MTNPGTTPNYTFKVADLDYASRRGGLTSQDYEHLRRVDHILDYLLPERRRLGDPLLVYQNHPAYRQIKELLKWHEENPIEFVGHPRLGHR